MGQTIRNLSKRSIKGKPIFPHRFVIELCETAHVHYKNLRLVMGVSDWVSLAEGFRDSLDRWKKRGSPQPSAKNHIELCRKQVESEDGFEVLINLNKNLYKHHDGMIFAEGCEFKEDEEYIHFKMGDIRVELSLDQFNEVSDAIIEAKAGLKDCGHSTVLQAT